MTIFSNDCTVTELYKNLLGTEYNHPLFNTATTYSEFITFLQQFNKIDLKKFRVIKLENYNDNHYLDVYPNAILYKDRIWGVYIDETVFFCYIHIFENQELQDKQFLSYGNIAVNNIVEYISNSYKDRLSRYKVDDNIIFIYNQKQIDTYDDIKRLCNIELDNKYKLYIYTEYNCTSYRDNIIIIRDKIDQFGISFREAAKQVYNIIKN